MQTMNLSFQVRRCQPELISPANPTPHEFKQLSDIDDQQDLRFQIPVLNIYQHNPSSDGRDPVKIIREAVAKTLVFYYPLAGRLREGPGRKLFVECTGEGILFIEAHADVTVEQYCEALQVSFLKIDDFVYNVPNSDGILHSPILLIQTIREIARGAFAPSIFPVWQRALLTARDPPRITCRHYECDQVVDTNTILGSINNMVNSLFFFGPLQISTLRRSLHIHLRECSSFELITAFVWHLRTIALRLNLDEELRLLCLTSLHSKINLPLGYYGNAFVIATAITTVAKLCWNPIGYGVELIKKAKATLRKEYIKSTLDLMVINGRPGFTKVGSYVVSDLTRMGFEEVDFGWGKAIYGGLITGESEDIIGMLSLFNLFKNKKGEKGIVVHLSLPAPAMEAFIENFHASFQVKQLSDEVDNHKQTFNASAL